MASSKQYLEFVISQASQLKEISFRKMMGEYVIYYHGKVIGGIYDDRLLLKPTKSAVQMMTELKALSMAIPYKGAKEMLEIEPDDQVLMCRLFQVVADDLPDAGKTNK